MADKEKATRSLMETYRIWNYTVSKHKHLKSRVNNLLAATYRAVMKEQVGMIIIFNRVSLCQIQAFKITFELTKKL